MAAAYDGDGNRVFQLNYNPEAEGNCHEDCQDAWGCYEDDRNKGGVLFPEDYKLGKCERNLFDKAFDYGHGDDYELIEYINDVNREYTEVLVEQSVHGRTETSYIYGVDRLSMDSFTGHSGYYLYDPRGSVTGITGECGHLYQSYQYSVTGEITFGAPKYENEYTYNGESYNPNIESQYLRARYYCVVTATFLTEDSYLGDITEPLTLNRYNYCLSSYLNYQDPSGNYTAAQGQAAHDALQKEFLKRYESTQYTAYAPYYIPRGYEYSITGSGYADMVLEHPSGELEVYEIKSGYNNIAKEVRDIALAEGKNPPEINYLIGYDQRIGYENALERYLGLKVTDATTFVPNGLTLPIRDTEYQYAVYYSYPDQPGMIYYWLKKGEEKPEPLLVRMKEAEKKKDFRECLNEIINVGKLAIEISVAAEVIKQKAIDWGIFLDKKLYDIFPIMFVPNGEWQIKYPVGTEGDYSEQMY